MSETRPVPVADLRRFITDPGELAKGAEIAEKGGLAHLAKHGAKLFADAAGSGPMPYKTQIVFAEDKITARCSCMAARSRPFCKHAAALLVAWARTPEAFAVAEAPPVAEEAARRRASVKKGSVDADELRRKGVDQASTVLLELWQTGVGALAADRAAQVGDLAETLRELGLRRLSSRTLELAALLELAARRDGSLPTGAYATLVADMWLTVRKLEKHLAGEPLADEHVEELIGKTWTKKDRKPVEGLDVFEYAFRQRETLNDFVVRESRLFDLASGEHFAEKQILPAMIARRTPPKPSYAGLRLRGARGSMFPSFAPRRVDLETEGERRELDGAALELAVERALPSVSKALAALAERRRDVFAPPRVPVLVRVDLLVPSRDRIRFVDDEGGALFLSGGRPAENALVAALASATAVAVFGDVALEGALPSLLPLAIVGRSGGELRLLPIGDDGRDEDEPRPGARGSWSAVAKQGGVSTAATLLGEVRDDLATAFEQGAAVASTGRFLAPIVARLGELRLEKQADALRAIEGANDPAVSLDGLVKVHQVLGIALSRLASAAPLDRASLVTLPTIASVAIPRPAAALAPDAAVAAEARGEIHRFERAYHVGVHYAAVSPRELVLDVHRYWGDGDAAPFVIRAAEAHAELALEGARDLFANQTRGAAALPRSRLAKITAIRILEAAGTPAARHVLGSLDLEIEGTPLMEFARRALHGPRVKREEIEDAARTILAGSTKESRSMAIRAISYRAAVEGISAIRPALRDRTADVREEAAYGLALLGDTLSLETFVGWLESDDAQMAKVGARAIGWLGDMRGVGPLLAALSRGFSPTVVRESLELVGPGVLGPLLDLAESQPELAKRAAVSTLVKGLAPRHASRALGAWLAAVEDRPDALLHRARLALDVSSQAPDTQKELAGMLRDRPELAGDDKERRALAKKIASALAPPKPPKAPAGS